MSYQSQFAFFFSQKSCKSLFPKLLCQTHDRRVDCDPGIILQRLPTRKERCSYSWIMIRKRFPCRKTWDLYSLRIQKGLCIIVYCIQWPQNGEGSRFFRSTKHHSSESFEREEKKKGRNDCVTFLMFVSEKLGENEQDDKKRCQTEIKCTKMSLEMFLALQSKKGWR